MAEIITGSETLLISVLIRIQETEAFRDPGFDCKGLHTYAVKFLNLTDSVACSYRTVVNHAILHPELKCALETKKLTVAVASKIVSSLTEENISEVIEFASTHSVRETETWLIREKGVLRKSQIAVMNETIELLRDLKNIMPGNVTNDEALQKAIREYLERHDPVERAKRAAEKKKRKPKNAKPETNKKGQAEPNTKPESYGRGRVEPNSDVEGVRKPAKRSQKKRRPFTAEQKHAINLRDENRCTYHDESGKRCESRRWNHKHHVIHVRDGGSNDPENIVTLCPEHHDLVHQMNFDFGTARDWLSSASSASQATSH